MNLVNRQPFVNVLPTNTFPTLTLCYIKSLSLKPFTSDNLGCIASIRIATIACLSPLVSKYGAPPYSQVLFEYLPVTPVSPSHNVL